MKHQIGTKPEANTLYYTTTDGIKIEIYEDIFDGKIISHTYKEQGVIIFDRPITRIPAYAFSRCNTLVGVTMPESVKNFYSSSFSDCANLKEFNHSCASADKRCLICNGTLKLFAPSNITEYTIPNGVTAIGKSVFRGTKLKKIVISEGVQIIDSCAFQFCKNLCEVIMPNSILEIGQSAFSNCTKLKSITIPSSIKYIGDWAFVGCKSLQEFNSNLATIDKRCLVLEGELSAFAPAGITDYVFPPEIVSYKKTIFDYNNKLKGLKKKLDEHIYKKALTRAESKQKKKNDTGNVIIAITQSGYIKKTLKNEFSSQDIGTKGNYKNYYADGVTILKETTLWDTLLLFTKQGLCYKIDVSEIPNTNKQPEGLSLYEKFSITNDSFCDILPTRNLFNSDKIEKYSVLIMKKEGLVVRNKLSDYKSIKNGQCVTCINSRTNTDYVASVSLTKDEDFVFNCSIDGYGKSFYLNEIRVSKLNSKNIGDYCNTIRRKERSLVSIDTIDVPGCGYNYDSRGRFKIDYNNLSGASYLLVSNKGLLIRTFTCLDRKNGDGKMLMKLNNSDCIVSNLFVLDINEMLIVTSKGNTIRIDVAQLNLEKLGGKGIQCVKLSDDDKIVACCKMASIENIAINIDDEKVKGYMQQTQESQSLLSTIFNNEGIEENVINSKSENIIKDMLSLLFEKEQWDRKELESMCNSRGIMLGSILEEINDYAYSTIDDAVVEEDGDCIYVTLDYKNELL